MWRVRTIATGVAGSPWYINTYWASGTGQPAQAAASRMRAFWNAVAPVLTNTVVYSVDTTVFGIDETDGEIGSTSNVTVAPVTGGASFGPLPTATQVNIRLVTGSYRRNRQVLGHLYVPGLASNGATLNTTGGLSTASRSTIQTAAAALVDSTVTDSRLVVWSRPRAAVINPPSLPLPGFTSPVVAADTRTTFAVLRSRRD